MNLIPFEPELNSIAINDMYDRAICSSLYEVFYVHRTDLLLPHYLELIIRQKWFTRYCEFLGQGSAKMCIRDSSYGDTQYPAHVLRYYPYGRAFTAGGNQAIVEVALTQLGNQGGQPYWSWYGFNSRVEWCACFVSWCADQCGYIESGLVPKFAGCVDGANWFKSNGKWQDRTYEPKTGDIIFFDWEGDGTTDHVGIVEKCENGTVYTVEGNSGDACKQRQYAVGSSNKMCIRDRSSVEFRN